MIDLVWVLLLAVCADGLVGDPVYRFHPVRLMGRLANGLEFVLRRFHADGVAGGTLLLLLHCGIFTGAYAMIRIALSAVWPVLSTVWDTYVLFSMYAHRDLLDHANRVYAALKNDSIQQARHHVSMMVSRDTVSLDAAGVSRAVIESVSENFVDGTMGVLVVFVSGFVFAACQGINIETAAIGATVFYRCCNTLDAMVGYKTERYYRFGKVSARVDDVLNYIPARISVPALLLAGVILRRSVFDGFREWQLSRGLTASPNSGHPESTVAGLLNVQLGGPARYNGRWTDCGVMNKGGSKAAAEHIRQCILLVALANGICVVCVAVAIFCYR